VGKAELLARKNSKYLNAKVRGRWRRRKKAEKEDSDSHNNEENCANMRIK